MRLETFSKTFNQQVIYVNLELHRTLMQDFYNQQLTTIYITLTWSVYDFKLVLISLVQLQQRMLL